MSARIDLEAVAAVEGAPVAQVMGAEGPGKSRVFLRNSVAPPSVAQRNEVAAKGCEGFAPT